MVTLIIAFTAGAANRGSEISLRTSMSDPSHAHLPQPKTPLQILSRVIRLKKSTQHPVLRGLLRRCEKDIITEIEAVLAGAAREPRRPLNIVKDESMSSEEEEEVDTSSSEEEEQEVDNRSRQGGGNDSSSSSGEEEEDDDEDEDEDEDEDDESSSGDEAGATTNRAARTVVTPPGFINLSAVARIFGLPVPEPRPRRAEARHGAVNRDGAAAAHAARMSNGFDPTRPSSAAAGAMIPRPPTPAAAAPRKRARKGGKAPKAASGAGPSSAFPRRRWLPSELAELTEAMRVAQWAFSEPAYKAVAVKLGRKEAAVRRKARALVRAGLGSDPAGAS